MPKRKRYLKNPPDLAASARPAAEPLGISHKDPPLIPSRTLLIYGNSGKSGYEFGKWYGKGINEIVSACQDQIQRFILHQDGDVSMQTVKTYCVRGLATFLPFAAVTAAAAGRPLSLSDVNRDLIDGYLQYLRMTGTGTSNQKGCYQATKSVLQAIAVRGLLAESRSGDDQTFPRNPFSGVHRTIKGETRLSRHERTAITLALHKAVAPLFSDNVSLTSELLSYALLIVALHTGRNTTPLLEMTIDCLRPHPKDETMFLVLYKRRSHRENAVPITAVTDSTSPLRPTVYRIVQRLIELTAGIRPRAPAHLRKRLWLYESKSLGNGVTRPGDVAALSEDSLARSIAILVRTSNLEASDGTPLRVNVSRLRKTFVNRIFEILGGDLVATAHAAGNTPAISDQSYLKPGEDAQKNWRFLGHALTNELLTATLGASEKTPVGRCTDTLEGEYAPKDKSAPCMNFLNCLRCRNYIVTGDDLYRLFSFYWRLLRERNRMPKGQWDKHCSHIVRLIDRDVVEPAIERGLFRRDAVDAERLRARHEPHPFWKDDQIISKILGDIA